MSKDNNISIVRYVLALSVLIAHFNLYFGCELWWPIASGEAVGGFFALSGLLIYKSYRNSPSLGHYFKRRACRIFPPYLFIVLLCAFGCVVFSSVSAKDYFLSAEWWRYLGANLSFLNFLGPTLPGVFESHAEPAVNGSLWTLKVEWMLYISLPILLWLHRKLKLKRAVSFALLLVFSVAYRLFFEYLYEQTGNKMYYIMSYQFVAQMIYFYTGVAVYMYFDWFKKHCIWLCLVLGATFFAGRQFLPITDAVLLPILFSLVVLLFATKGKWGVWINKIDNVSYDMYLVHIPVIHVALCLGADTLPVWASFVIVLTATVGLSLFSWHCIGKRWLKR